MSICPLQALAIHSLSRLAFMGAAAGVYLFVRGFLLLARQRLLAHTPTSQISGATTGLLEVSGSVSGPYTLQAPITGETCFLYRVIAWKAGESRNDAAWTKVAEETQYTPFFLNDATGQLLVDAEGAELELAQDFRQEFDVSAFSDNDLLPLEVSSFLERHGVAARGRIRVEESLVGPNETLFVLGTVDQGPLKRSAAVQPASPLRKVSPNQFEASAPQTIRLSEGSAPANASEMTLQGKIAAALVKAGMQNGEIWESGGFNGKEATEASPKLSQLVINDNAQSEPGTNSQGFVLHKGRDNPTFLISRRRRQDVIRSLNWKSFAMIWGGIGLILVGMYILLA